MTDDDDLSDDEYLGRVKKWGVTPHPMPRSETNWIGITRDGGYCIIRKPTGLTSEEKRVALDLLRQQLYPCGEPD